MNCSDITTEIEVSSRKISRRKLLKLSGVSIISIYSGGLLNMPIVEAKDMVKGANNFYKSDRVTLEKVSFPTQYRLKVVGNLIRPKDLSVESRAPAIIVGHPMGAVKEQAATLYATKMAEYGFVTLAIDLPYWGESGGDARNLVAPDAYVEAFSAAADYLASQKYVDHERIGVIGVCASGGFAIAAAKIDPRLKAVATASMLDMGGATRMMAREPEQWQAMIQAATTQRQVEFSGGAVEYTGGTVLEITEDTPQFQRDFYDFYRTPRGKVIPQGASDLTVTRPTLSSNTRFLNFYPLNDIERISPRPILFIAGAEAISLGFSQDAYSRAADPKELYLVSGANHVDLYDRIDVIPFDKLNDFFSRHLS